MPSRPLCLVAAVSICIATWAAGSAQAADAPPPEAAVVEQLLQGYEARDWARLRSLLDSELDAEADRLEQVLEQLVPHLGAFHGSVLAQRKPVDLDCWEQVHVLRHARSNATLTLQACPRSGNWKIGFIEFAPSTRTLVDAMFDGQMADALEVRFERPHCRSWPTSPAEFDCRAVTESGLTLDVTLAFRGKGQIGFVSHRPVIRPPEASRALLEAAAHRVLDRLSRREFQAIADASTGPLREADKQRFLLVSLPAARRILGPVRDVEWLGMAGERTVAVQLQVRFAEHTVPIELVFAPEGGEWRLAGLDIDLAAGSPEALEVAEALLAVPAQQMAGDPHASVDCAGRLRTVPGERVMCSLSAHGRTVPVEVVVRADDAPPGSDPVTLRLQDFSTLVHGMLADAEPELGWSVKSVSCGKSPVAIGGTAECLVRGVSADRRITLFRYGPALRFIDVEVLQDGSAATQGLPRNPVTEVHRGAAVAALGSPYGGLSQEP